MSGLLTRVQNSALNLAMNVIKPDILIVLSLKDNSDQLCALLTKYDVNITLVHDVQTAFESLKSHINSFLMLDLDVEESVLFLEKVVDNFYDPPPYIIAVGYFPCSMSQADTLNLGADACLEKPLDLKEVMAVINAVLRRTERLARPQPLHAPAQIERKGLTIDSLRRYVCMDGQLVSLTVKEFDILNLLARHPDIVFSKEQIYEQIWNEDFRYSTTSVSDLISSLRKKLGLNARDNRYIQTVYGYGYRFSEPG